MIGESRSSILGFRPGSVLFSGDDRKSSLFLSSGKRHLTAEREAVGGVTFGFGMELFNEAGSCSGVAVCGGICGGGAWSTGSRLSMSAAGTTAANGSF